MTLSAPFRPVSLRPKLISCGSTVTRCNPRQCWPSAALPRLVSRLCETEGTEPGAGETPYHSIGYGVLHGTGQDETRMIRTPPFTSRFHARGFHICCRLEKWRGVRGEPFAPRLCGAVVAA